MYFRLLIFFFVLVLVVVIVYVVEFEKFGFVWCFIMFWIVVVEVVVVFLFEYLCLQFVCKEWFNFNGIWDYWGGKGVFDVCYVYGDVFKFFDQVEQICVFYLVELCLFGLEWLGEVNFWYCCSFELFEGWWGQ